MFRRKRHSHPHEKYTTPLASVLIVDEEPSICSSMSEYFSHHGFVTHTAHDPEEAEPLIYRTNYNVVIQDLRLGGRSTSEALNIMRLVHSRDPETKIIVLTAYRSPELEDQARRCGASTILRKPKRLSEIVRVVEDLISTRAYRPKLQT